MKTKIIIGILSILILSSTLAIVFTIAPKPVYPDPSKFKSEVTRIAEGGDLLDILYFLESLNGSEIYFDSLGDDFDWIENISALIDNELEFLATYNPKDFKPDDWRSHKFIYEGTIIESINQTEFLSLINLEQLYLHHFFFYNFTEGIYFANSTAIPPYPDPSLWDLSSKVDYVYSINPEYLFVNQTVVISDLFAPLAGTGTSFERTWLCLPTGQPILFFSNEGGWWIS